MKKKINNDKRRRDMVVGKVVAHCMSNTNYMKKKLTMIKGEGTW